MAVITSIQFYYCLYSDNSSARVIIKPKRIRWLEHVVGTRQKRNVYRLLVGKPEGKRPLGCARRRWRDNIKVDRFEIGLSVVDLIGLAQNRDI
jgi:hypothetical protein